MRAKALSVIARHRRAKRRRSSNGYGDAAIQRARKRAKQNARRARQPPHFIQRACRRAAGLPRRRFASPRNDAQGRVCCLKIEQHKARERLLIDPSDYHCARGDCVCLRRADWLGLAVGFAGVPRISRRIGANEESSALSDGASADARLGRIASTGPAV
jgi:hypothetical protein